MEAVRQQEPTREKEKKEMDVQTETDDLFQTGVQTEEHTGIQTEEQTSGQKNEPTSIQKSEQTSSPKSEQTSSPKSEQTSGQKSEQTKEETGGGKEETPMARLMEALRAARSLFGLGEVEVRAVPSSSVDGLSK